MNKARTSSNEKIYRQFQQITQSLDRYDPIMDKHLLTYFQKPAVLKVLKKNRIIDRYGNVIDRKIIKKAMTPICLFRNPNEVIIRTSIKAPSTTVNSMHIPPSFPQKIKSGTASQQKRKYQDEVVKLDLMRSYLHQPGKKKSSLMGQELKPLPKEEFAKFLKYKREQLSESIQ